VILTRATARRVASRLAAADKRFALFSSMR
jgi:hypothetical protein